MDVDNGRNGTSGVIYRLVDTDMFAIDEASGQLTLNKSLDREANDSYRFTVGVSFF